MTDHCATFSDSILKRLGALLPVYLPAPAILHDPFAGVGKGVNFLQSLGYISWGTELEPEWAEQSDHVICMDFFKFAAQEVARRAFPVDGVVTSPAYGNRMADVDMRESVAGTYAKSLGRKASEGSSCHLQWGDAYRRFHEDAWHAVTSILRPGGLMVLNVKNHIRAQHEVHVAEWHLSVFEALGYHLLRDELVSTPSLRRGENSQARVDHEHIYFLEGP